MRAVILLGVISLAIAPIALCAEPNPNPKEQALLRKIAHDYAACVVHAHHAKASEAILATADNQAVINRYPEILDSDCLDLAAGSSVGIRFPNATYLSALADALVNADFASHGEASFANRLPLAQPLVMSAEKSAATLAEAKPGRKRRELEEKLQKQDTGAWVSRYGECVARQDPVNVRYWLLTRPDTPEETSRIKALQPAFDICLGDGTVTFNRLTMRGTVAINYYRLAMATIVPGAGSSR